MSEAAAPEPARSNARPSSIRLGSVPADSAQDLRFLQDRIALFAKTIFVISTGFVVVFGLLNAKFATGEMLHTSRRYHLIATLIALAIWLVARGKRQLSPHVLHAVDGFGTLAICWSFCVMGFFAVEYGGYLSGMQAIAYTSTARAIIAPSTPRRTLWVSSACFLGIFPVRWFSPMPEFSRFDVLTRWMAMTDTFLWTVAGVTLATVASAVIYGLREKVMEARQLGQYTLEDKIGEGGMGQVYRASHAMLRRPTAIKLLAGQGSEAELRRFEREVQLTSALTHPNTISIYDYGRTPDGTFYYAMELLDGMTLEELVTTYGPQPPARVIHLLLQVAGALREAHGVGLIHRDIKPANIFLCQRGSLPDVIKVLDFGLVKQLQNGVAMSQSNVDFIVGTPLYIAPEAIASPSRVDARSDLYALGAVAYFLLTGRPVFQGQTVVEICSHHLHSPPIPPSELAPVVAKDLEAVVLACLAKLPENRPASAEQLANALKSCKDASAWTEAEAAAWWKNCPKVSDKRVTTEIDTRALRRTIKIDLEERLQVSGERAVH